MDIKNKNMKELSVEANIENLDSVQDFISEMLEASGCSMKLQMQINLVAEEIFANIVQYAYSQEAQINSLQNDRVISNIGKAIVRVSVDNEIIIEFEDSGKPFNPLEKNDPDITLKAEERELGGLGIFMVKKLMDSIKYRYEDNKNILVIKKVFEDIIA